METFTTLAARYEESLMGIDGSVARLTIYLGAADRTGQRPAPEDLVARAHAAGLTGATVARAPQPDLETGAPRTISLSHPATVTVTVLGTEPALRAFIEQLDDLREAGATMLLEGAEELHEAATRPAGS